VEDQYERERVDSSGGRARTRLHVDSDTGEQVRLSALRGKPVVLYFYPKDETPGSK